MTNSCYLGYFTLSCLISLIVFSVVIHDMDHGGGRWGMRTLTERGVSNRTRLNPYWENNPHPVVIFNVLPKSGSRTLNTLVGRLRRNITMANTMNDINESHEEKEYIINATIRSNETSFVYSHCHFKWMGPFGPKVGVRRPIYISVVRDPIERLASHYYFVRYGDGNANKTNASLQFREEMQSRHFSRESFDTCVLKEKRGCRNPVALMRHFSGDNRQSVDQALKNIDTRYMVVGIMEDYLSFLRILELRLPQVFGGISDIYKKERKGIISAMKTKHKRSVSKEVREILRKEMTRDYEVYEAIRLRFEILKLELGIS